MQKWKRYHRKFERTKWRIFEEDAMIFCLRFTSQPIAWPVNRAMGKWEARRTKTEDGWGSWTRSSSHDLPRKKTRAKTTSLGRGLVVRRPTSLGFFPLYQCCASRPIAPRLLGIDQEGLSQLPRRIHSWLRKSNPSWRTLNRRESENNTHPSVLNQLTRRYQKATEFVTGSKLFKHPNGFEKSRNSSESFRIWFVSLRETHEAIPLCGATLRPTPNDLDGWAWPTFSIPRYLSNQSSDWTYSNLKMFGAV